ncbi:hypothetical protein BBFL7_00018 [Flavobacteria bacterium BBFL7]|nr:hypothetical protein BBFL7_00018 [Flavobacteria bacterium BBFL7]
MSTNQHIMKHLYSILIVTLFTITAQAQYIEFDFDTATINGNTVTQDITVNGIGYRLTAVHGSNSPAALFDDGTGDLSLRSTGGSRPEQNWTLTLIKAGSSENFDFVSVDYFNNSGATHTFIIGDSNNNAISAQTTISPSDTGTMIVATPANAVNLPSCLIYGFSFSATIDTYFDNLRIRPVSLLSNEDETLESVQYFQNDAHNVVLSHRELEGATIDIMNLNGQLLSTLTADAVDYEIDVANLASGLYVARVTMDDQVETIKFIK